MVGLVYCCVACIADVRGQQDMLPPNLNISRVAADRDEENTSTEGNLSLCCQNQQATFVLLYQQLEFIYIKSSI